MDNHIKFLKTNVSNLKNSYVLLNPTRIYESYRFKIDELESSLTSIIKDKTNKLTLSINKQKEIIKIN